MTEATAPLATVESSAKLTNDAWELSEFILDPANFLVRYDQFDPIEDKYMAISLNYRGEITSKQANECVQKIKKKNKVAFVEWMPTGFKIGLNKITPVKVGNNIAINPVLTEWLSKKYEMM